MSALGSSQAEATATCLRAESVDAIWVSPLVRAQQTAQPIAEALGRVPETLDWLEEVRVPAMYGLRKEELAELLGRARRVPVERWWQGLDGCESYRDFERRVSGGLDSSLADAGVTWTDAGGARIWHGLPKGRTVVVVCHGGTTAVAVSHLVGLGQVPWSWVRLPVGHCGLAECRSTRISDGRAFSLARLDDRTHLPESAHTL